MKSKKGSSILINTKEYTILSIVWSHTNHLL
jgi:hypothetical protein